MSAQAAAPRKRRTRGEGSIYQTAKGWRAALLVRDPATGKASRRYLSGATADEVRRKLTTLRAEADRGATGAAPRLTTGAYLATWLVAAAPTIRASTLVGYRGHVERYWHPAIGAVPLARLSPAQVEAAMAGLAARGISPTTIHGARSTLRRALGRAVRDGLVMRNAASLASPPRMPHHDIEYLDPAQVRAMIEATSTDEHGAAWTLAATTGLRLGELLGLSWADVGTGTLTVRRALARNAAGGWSLAEPKTLRSKRTIPLPAVARAALEDQRGRQAATREAVGTAWQDRDGLIFTDAVGRPILPSTMSKLWLATSRRLGLDVPFRALRHTAATTWLRSGVPLIVVADALGHTGVAITAAHYAAVAPELRAATADAMDRALA